MSFEEPVWLYLTPLLLLLFGAMLVYGFRRRDALLGRFAASRLLDQLTEQASRPRTWIKAACVLLAVAAISIALARPQYGVEWSERKARGLDIVFVLDSSKSMLATDLRPTRLDRAKLAIIDLVERLESDRIGLVAFAGQAFLQTPPTLDYSAFRESLDAVDPGIMTSGGSDLGNAINEAAEAFPSENNVKVVVLLTDGEDLGGQAAAAAKKARESGIQVFAIGIGTPEGEYLKVQNAQGIEEFVRDSDGKPVRSQLDEPTLQQIAQATGGSYRRLSSESLDQLYRNVIATLPREERESEMQEIRIERFQWALSAAAFFLVLETLIRRRRSATIQAGMVVILSLGFSPSHAEAQDSITAEETENAETRMPTKADARSLYNSAYESLSTGDYATAAQLYESALSKSQDLKLQRDALYNMGHATYQQGRAAYEGGDPQAALEQMKKAEGYFQSAQEIDPTDASIKEDAEQVTKVRETIEKLMEQQQEQQQDEQQNQQDSEDSEDSEQKQDQSQDSQQQEGDSEQNQDDSQQGDQQDSQSADEGEQQESQDSQSGEQSEDAQQDQGSQQDQQGDESSQSSQDSQGEQSESGEQNEADPSQTENTDSQSEPQSQSAPQEGEPEDGEHSPGAPQESTEDPVDDIPQPQAGEESDESGETGEQAGVPEPTEGEAGEEGQAAGSVSGEPIEGMTEAEAAALLDTLRGKETLLPFIDQPRGGRQREIRDW